MSTNPALVVEQLNPSPLRHLGVLSREDRARLQREHEAMPYINEPFLPRKGIGIIGGDSGIGKTPFNYQKVVAAATGMPFLGKPSVPSRVLYFDLEPGPINFLDEFERSIGRSVPEDMFYTVQALDKPQDARRIIEATRPNIVEIDTLRQFWPGMTKDNDVASQALKLARNWTNEFDVFVNFIHHLKKPDRKDPPAGLRYISVSEWFLQLEGARGLYNHTDLRVAVEKSDTPGIDLLIKYNFRNMGDSPLIALRREYSDETGDACGYNLAPISTVLSQERQNFYNQLPADRDLTPKLMRDISGLSRDTIYKAMAELNLYGLVVKPGRGVWRRTGSLVP